MPYRNTSNARCYRIAVARTAGGRPCPTGGGSYGPMTRRLGRGPERPAPLSVTGMRVLVTGGAGFIGSQVVEALLARGHEPVVLDALLPAAHPSPRPRARGSGASSPTYGTGRPSTRPCAGVDAVCHQAAMVGLGRDFADAPDYVGCNDLGTAVLLAAMAEAGVRELVLAGSMVVYGEGRYDCPRHGRGAARPAGRWPTWTPGGSSRAARTAARSCGRGWSARTRRPTRATSTPTTKLAQEHLAAAWARATGGRAVSLRYHNVYGPGMPRDTPYAGVASFFRSALARGRGADGLRGRRPAAGLRPRTGRRHGQRGGSGGRRRTAAAGALTAYNTGSGDAAHGRRDGADAGRGVRRARARGDGGVPARRRTAHHRRRRGGSPRTSAGGRRPDSRRGWRSSPGRGCGRRRRGDPRRRRSSGTRVPREPEHTPLCPLLTHR